MECFCHSESRKKNLKCRASQITEADTKVKWHQEALLTIRGDISQHSSVGHF